MPTIITLGAALVDLLQVYVCISALSRYEANNGSVSVVEV